VIPATPSPRIKPFSFQGELWLPQQTLTREKAVILLSPASYRDRGVLGKAKKGVALC